LKLKEIGIMTRLIIFISVILISTKAMNQTKDHTEEATFGAGCFWCVEAIFNELQGVLTVDPGYAGGKIKNPSYREVSSGETGHAEVCRIVYDTREISFEDLLEIFWQTHDPTTLNRQGADIGTQYRSVIFYHNEKQRNAAESFKELLNKSDAFRDPVVTEIAALNNYYPAEDYHQDYFKNNPNQPYCNFVIKPKLEKFRKLFPEKQKAKKQ